MKTNTPHDAIFKQFLGHIEVARDFLKVHLPLSIQQNCNFSKLAIEPGSFVEEDLKQLHSDILYSLPIKQQKGYIYCLIEHQSSENKLMAFRLLRYSLAAMQRHLNQGNQSLPIVVPMLFYHGEKSPYPFTMNWLDCFEQRDLAAEVYHHSFPLVDVTCLSDEEIAQHGQVSVLEYVQKHIRIRDSLEIIREMIKLIKHWQISNELRQHLLIYIARAGNTDDQKKFIRAVIEQSPDLKEEMMTVAEYLKSEGLQEGIQQGMQQGIKEGYFKQKMETVQRCLNIGLDRSTTKAISGLSDQEIDEIIKQLSLNH